jgi:hypothetical protein
MDIDLVYLTAEKLDAMECSHNDEPILAAASLLLRNFVRELDIARMSLDELVKQQNTPKWHGLTEAERNDVVWSNTRADDLKEAYDVAVAIEQALRDKNT